MSKESSTNKLKKRMPLDEMVENKVLGKTEVDEEIREAFKRALRLKQLKIEKLRAELAAPGGPVEETTEVDSEKEIG